jgi:hypothetical protein
MATAATYFECTDCDIPEISVWRRPIDHALFGIAPAVAAVLSMLVTVLIYQRMA